MLDSPPTWHKLDFLMGYKHVVCNTGGTGFDYTLQHFIIMFYSVQNQCTDGPLASCASGQSTTYINY